MQRGFAAQIAALVAVAGFLCFAGGYAVTGGITKQAGQYTYGEKMTCNVKIENLGIDRRVTFYKGMTPFDALLRITSVKTAYYEGMGSIVTEIGGVAQSWGYKVNGATPSVGMMDYQLLDGDNLELYKLEW